MIIQLFTDCLPIIKSKCIFFIFLFLDVYLYIIKIKSFWIIIIISSVKIA